MANRKRKGPFCGGKLRPPREGTCQQPPGAGTSHPGFGRCLFHGGSGPSGVKAGERAMAEDAVARLGLPVRTTAEAALQDALNRANGNVLFLAGKVSELGEESRTWGQQKRTRTTTAGGGNPAETVDSTVLGTGVSVWETLLMQWDRQLTVVATEMLRAGVEERAVAVHEAEAQALFRLLGAVLTDPRAHVPAEVRGNVLALMPEYLRELDGDGR
jgi:hypothetical protein